ncbi:hypothetical protein KX816_10120 [Sphingosinicellaceae bacterium]|nr:hypothetical protein KX816_10120 [Sphingosinicellaceae bacterium]
MDLNFIDDPQQGTYARRRFRIACVLLSGGSAAGIATRIYTGSLRMPDLYATIHRESNNLNNGRYREAQLCPVTVLPLLGSHDIQANARPSAGAYNFLIRQFGMIHTILICKIQTLADV